LVRVVLFSVFPSILLDIINLLKILLFFFQVIKFVFSNNFLDFALLLLYVFLHKFILLKNLLFVIVNMALVLGPKLSELGPIMLLDVSMGLHQLHLSILSF